MSSANEWTLFKLTSSVSYPICFNTQVILIIQIIILVVSVQMNNLVLIPNFVKKIFLLVLVLENRVILKSLPMA